MYTAVIADDEPLIRMDIKEILELNGYDVVGDAFDGFDAVELCRKYRPDFVIMDIKMPILDGIKAAEIINAEKLVSCVLLLTAYSDRSMIEQAANADVMSYLVKPIDESALIPAIEIALHNQRKIRKMSQEYRKAKEALESRKTVDRAKGILMDGKGMSELAAYQYLRKVAMDKECTIAQIAKMIIISNR